MTLDTQKIPRYILADLEEGRTSRAPEVRDMSSREAFELWCSYNGLINWSERIMDALDTIRAAEVKKP